MKHTYHINNLDELKTVQSGLRLQQALLGEAIISQGKTAVSLPLSRLGKPADPLRQLNQRRSIDLAAKGFSYLIPLIVNRTLFRRSSFLAKIVITIIARRLAKKYGPKITGWLLQTIHEYVINRKGNSINSTRLTPLNSPSFNRLDKPDI